MASLLISSQSSNDAIDQGKFWGNFFNENKVVKKTFQFVFFFCQSPTLYVKICNTFHSGLRLRKSCPLAASWEVRQSRSWKALALSIFLS